jgi:hypothetical protein
MYRYFGWVAGTVVVVLCTLGVNPATAAVKVIGDFEGNFDSPYTVDWSADPLLTAEFISADNPDYHGGITLGQQALLLTTPDAWGPGEQYFRLSGGEELMQDIATYPYLLFDVTTYGGADTPEEGPEWRQVFNIFNNAVTTPGWYDSNPDSDIQRDFPVPGFADESLTTTVVVDMNGPDPAVDGDGMNFMHLRAKEALADHTDGTPIENFYWDILWVFQGGHVPDTDQIQMVIDNVRFCDTLDCTPSMVLAGDYNEDGSVDAADYVVWRNNLGGNTLPNETVTPGVVDQDDYTEWRSHFQSAALGAAGGGAVPEPAGVLLALCAIVVGVSMRAGRR